MLSVSYNNLVDWHVFVQEREAAFVFNRLDPPKVVESAEVSAATINRLHRDAFEKVIGSTPSPNLPALDDALVQTTSEWKRNIAAELGTQLEESNGALSALFNAILFARAAEDSQHRRGAGRQESLVDRWLAGDDVSRTVGRILEEALEDCFIVVPAGLFSPGRLRPFDRLSGQTVLALLKDFYGNRYYNYDFSLISKHALSRIYEHHVSLLRVEDSPQASLFPLLPREELDRSYGSVYTPQYIARFFARFLEREHTPHDFQRMRVVDPACGSGIFLRTILEKQCETMLTTAGTEEVARDLVSNAFSGAAGIDVDENAAFAGSSPSLVDWAGGGGCGHARFDVNATSGVTRWRWWAGASGGLGVVVEDLVA